MAKLKKPPIPLKMYQHFAAVTVVMTAGIALFADGENREAMATHIEERERQQELQALSAEITGTRELVRRDERTRGTWGDEGGAMGAPSSFPQASSAGSGYRRGTGANAGSRRPAIAGYDREFVDSLSEEEYRAFLQSLPAEYGGSSGPDRSADQMAAVERASRQRSGNRGASADAPD